MAEEHTVRHMRNEYFAPKLALRGRRDGADTDVLARARAFVSDVRSRPWESRLPAGVRQQLLAAFPAIREAGLVAR
jgi:hypothetical protein